MPPYLAGREHELKEFQRLLKQDVVLENIVLTGLRGTGKTVLLDTFKPLAIKERWNWVGTDLSESTSISEERMAVRLLTDLAVISSTVIVEEQEVWGMGFQPPKSSISRRLSFENMLECFKETPGLVADKLKAILELIWRCLKPHGVKGIVFAYDEAQNLSDHASEKEYPLSLLLDVFQSIQKKEIPFMLVLVGLPTLFPKLVDARTFAERMFRVVLLDRLNDPDSRQAIRKPIQDSHAPINLDEESVEQIVEASGGYPYFIQFICRELYDALIQGHETNEGNRLPIKEITRKLDSDFFAGRWARVTERQRQLLELIAQVDSCERGFTAAQIAEKSKSSQRKPFGQSHISQMLLSLCESGVIHRSRQGVYAFAVPLLSRFILRQMAASR